MARKSKLSLLLERVPEQMTVVGNDTLTDVLNIQDPLLRRIKARNEIHFKSEYVFRKKENGLFFGLKQSKLTMIGGKVFTTSCWVETLVLDGRKCRTNCITHNSLKHLFSIVGIQWATRLCEEQYMSSSLNLLLNRVRIIKGILFGDICSMEDMYRDYAKSLKIKSVDWRLFKEYLDLGNCSVPICDMIAGTTDFQEAMRLTLHPTIPLDLFADAVKQAVILGRKVNPRWSERRLMAEHDKMTNILMLAQMQEKSDDAIYGGEEAASVEEDGVHLLNTEAQVFKEGHLQGHCLYTNYFKRIQAHDYLPFHISSCQEEATFGVVRDERGDSVTIDQVRLSHNRCPSEQLYQAVKDFVQRHAATLKRMLSCEKQGEKQEVILPF